MTTAHHPPEQILAPHHQVPVMELPTTELRAAATAARSLGQLLRRIREQRGRAAWDDAENAARKEQSAVAEGITPLTDADHELWESAERAGAVRTYTDAEAGLMLHTVDLVDGRVAVKVTHGDERAEGVVGSAAAADDLREWLWENQSPAATTQMREHVESQMSDEQKAGAWARQGANADIYEQYLRQCTPTPTGQGSYRYEPTDEARDFLINHWRTATGQDKPEQSAGDPPPDGPQAETSQSSEAPAMSLADRLRGRVPDTVLDDDRWKVAEKQFSTLVDSGANPDDLADAVAGITFDHTVRSPSGYASWMMRETAKRGPQVGGTEEDAARAVAEEWLRDEADPDNPLDRARAAAVVGRFDDGFDAELAGKFPGILDGDGAAFRANAEARAEDAEAHMRDDLTVAADYLADEQAAGDLDHPDAPRVGREAEAAEDQSYAEGWTEHAHEDAEHASQARADAEDAVTQPTAAAETAGRHLNSHRGVPGAATKPHGHKPAGDAQGPTSQRTRKRSL